MGFNLKRDIKRYLPSLLTIGNIACGFMAVAIGDIYLGAMFLLCGLFLDTFDGLLARAFNVQSEMGKELDSLADMISFGIAPAYLYTLIAPSEHWTIYIGPIFFVAGAAIRLAKFNTLPSSKDFEGLPTPFATLFLVGVFIGIQYDKTIFVNSMDSTVIYSLIPVFLGLFMVSTIPMFSLKRVNEGWGQNMFPLLCLGSFILMLFYDFRIAFSGVVLSYIFLSVVQKMMPKH